MSDRKKPARACTTFTPAEAEELMALFDKARATTREAQYVWQRNGMRSGYEECRNAEDADRRAYLEFYEWVAQRTPGKRGRSEP